MGKRNRRRQLAAGAGITGLMMAAALAHAGVSAAHEAPPATTPPAPTTTRPAPATTLPPATTPPTVTVPVTAAPGPATTIPGDCIRVDPSGAQADPCAVPPAVPVREEPRTTG